ncbi:MAG: putative type IIS restriction /modification enzyme, N-terminal half [Ignavibacteriae bacterium]|nr:MAG: putative type IIS restriction /modification enzyme, N-terminal half [Ignavibacteriota bacterium]
MKELDNLINQFNSDNLNSLLRAKSRSFRKLDESLSHLNDEQFNDCTLFGEFKVNDEDKMVVFTAKVNKPLSERSGKKAQYTLGKKFLRDAQKYIGGFFIFYDYKDDFRFSLIYDIPLATGRRDWSNFRRYTYFVSKDQTNKTFIKQIEEADFSSLEKIIEAFSVEKVTKQFYQEIANWYFWAMDKVEFPDDEEKDREKRNAKNLIRLITRIIFIWFMKEKNLVPSALFDKSFIDKIINYKDKTGSTYYKAILQNLFFATLNTQMKKDDKESRIFVEEAERKGYLNDAYLQQGYYRYSRFIKDKKLFLEQFENVPFLNGGLFECLDKKIDGKEIRIDCFSDNPKNETRLKVPDELFFLEEETETDLSNYLEKGKNKKVTGLLTILKRYNFTIDENTPIDQDVALDPELLGKVFENLLASYNPETATTARKATGSYYTPREIVEYMVNESLVAHLKTVLNNDNQEVEQKLRMLFDYASDENPFDEQTTLKLIDAIEKIKILDPACGSGAFPMGVLHKLVLALHKLDPENKIWKQRLLNRVPAEIRSETEQSLQNKSIDYIRKLGLIENCIYGVDIQEIAIQISKLRFFISLLVEQQIDDTKPNRDIRALPNLETKFVAANTLIGLNRPVQMSLVAGDIEELEKKLFEVREEIFYTNSRKEKLELQRKEKQLREKLKIALKQNGFQNDVAEKITSWDPFDQNTHAEWFDPEWMFGVKVNESSGFDIVIGNPPYIQLQKAISEKSKLKYADLYKDQNYKTFERTGDIYCLFYEKGINLLRKFGHLCYITSNKWMRAGYGETLREFFSKYNPKILVDLGPGIFESATVDTNILLIQKSNSKVNRHSGTNLSDEKSIFNLRALTLTKENNIDFNKQLNEKGVTITKLTKDAWFIGNNAEQKLKEKIERIGKPLKDWDVKIYRGVLTGLNEAFIITTEKRNEILNNCSVAESSRFGGLTERQRTEAIIKPILRGRDIKRYYYEWAGLWVIGTFPALHLNIEKFPALKKYFLDNFDIRQLEQSGKKYPNLGFNARKKTGNKWFETQDQIAYYSEFEKEKVVYSEIVRKPQFYFDIDNFYVEATSFLMTGKNLKYICGLLNSNPITFFFKKWYAGGGLGEEGYRYKKAFIEDLPFPTITPGNQSIVEKIEAFVDKILSAKKQNPQSDTSAWEKEIDHLVYQLYELTPEEIEIIEGGK